MQATCPSLSGPQKGKATYGPWGISVGCAHREILREEGPTAPYLLTGSMPSRPRGNLHCRTRDLQATNWAYCEGGDKVTPD